MGGVRRRPVHDGKGAEEVGGGRETRQLRQPLVHDRGPGEVGQHRANGRWIGAQEGQRLGHALGAQVAVEIDGDEVGRAAQVEADRQIQPAPGADFHHARALEGAAGPGELGRHLGGLAKILEGLVRAAPPEGLLQAVVQVLAREGQGGAGALHHRLELPVHPESSIGAGGKPPLIFRVTRFRASSAPTAWSHARARGFQRRSQATWMRYRA